jgi:hypothetical protein
MAKHFLGEILPLLGISDITWQCCDIREFFFYL